jgi:DNA-binding MarR family transcriptional regulator
MQTIDSPLLASELRVVLGQVVRRLRAENQLPLTQSAVMGRLERGGPRSVSDLAQEERIRPQSMSPAVAGLEERGFVLRRADPDDGRRALVELTDAGRAALDQDRRQRDAWLARAIADDLDPGEQAVLIRAVEILRRLACG